MYFILKINAAAVDAVQHELWQLMLDLTDLTGLVGLRLRPADLLKVPRTKLHGGGDPLLPGNAMFSMSI